MKHEHEPAKPIIANCMMCDAELGIGNYCRICEPWGDCFCSIECSEDYYADSEVEQ
jgi:hypothetical protein